MQSLLSLMKLSSKSSQEVVDSESALTKRILIPSLKIPFDNEKLRLRKEQENQVLVKISDLSNLLITFQSPQLNLLSQELIELDLSNNLLHVIPTQLNNCKNLVQLNISNNQISQIANKMTFSGLKILNLSGNQLKNIPTSLCKLQCLKVLLLNYNLIEIVAEDLFHLELITLGLRSNYFTVIPSSFKCVLKTLLFFDFDWLDYCQVTNELDNDSKGKLQQLATRSSSLKEVITFSLFFYYMTGNIFDIQSVNQLGQSIFFSFIEKESFGLIKFYCQRNSDTCKNTYDSYCPLTYAFAEKKYQCLQFILPLYHPQSREVEQIFLMSVRRLEISLLRTLITFGVDVNCISQDDFIGTNKQIVGNGQSAMHIAMTSFGRNVQQQQQAQSVVKLLLEFGCNPNSRNEKKLTSLHCAVKLPSLAAVRFASQISIFNFTKRDINKNTPLHSAAQLGLVTILQLIQGRNVNPFLINFNNKTAKQVSIASLQVIKMLRKYEFSYLKGRLLIENEDSRTHQISFNSFQSINQHYIQPFTEIKSEKQSLQLNSTRKVFRLNLSQVKLVEQFGRFNNKQQILSDRILAPSINDILFEIQKVLKENSSFNDILLQMRSLYVQSPTLQDKLFVIVFLSLMIMRMKFGWKYISSFSTTTLELLNNSKFNFIKEKSQEKYFANSNDNQVSKYKNYCNIVGNVTDTCTLSFIQLKNQLSLNLKYNLENNWKEKSADQEKFVQNSIGDQQWIIGMKGLKLISNYNDSQSNRSILYQYELYQNNCSSITQYLRVGQRDMDFYKEQRVDNSESLGSLSDRIHLYKKTFPKQTQNVGTQKQQLSNKMEFYSKNLSQTTRQVSPQVQQHLGEKIHPFRRASAWSSSNDFTLNNI